MTTLRCARVCGWFLVLFALLDQPVQVVRAAEPRSNEEAVEVVASTPDLIAFWTFSEPAGTPRVSIRTKCAHPLQEVGDPVERVEGGSYSGYSARFSGKNYLSLPHAQLEDLNIYGPEAQVSMFAVVRLDAGKHGNSIAGIWNEGKGANDDSGSRQYALLFDMPAYGGGGQLTPHISSVGGVSRRADGSRLPWCADYAASRTVLPSEQWMTLGFTYDSKYIRAYVNGVMEERPLNPKQDRRDDRYFTQEGPDGKDRGMNPYFYDRGIFQYRPEVHAESKPDGGSDFTVGARYAVGSFYREALKGKMAGLAVIRRALSDDEMARLHKSARIETLK